MTHLITSAGRPLGRLLSAFSLAVVGLVGAAPAANAASGPWSMVSAGGTHTCGINSAKNLYCWGSDGTGQIGDGSAGGTQSTPKRVGGIGAWVSVSAGGTHTCGVTTAKNLYCWGDDGYGQIGDGTAGVAQPTMTRVGGSGAWVSVTTGDVHTCGVTTAKNLYCWGFDGYGQIGDGTVTAGGQPTMKRIGGSGVWTSVDAGGIHTCGVTTAKNLYCWGSDGYGQVGDGTASGAQPTMKRIGGSGAWTSVSGGGLHTCGVTTAKNLYCWGWSGFGQIGDGTVSTFYPTMKRIGGSGAWVAVSAGGNHTCGVTTAKNLYCWGNDDYGQIGDKTAGGNEPDMKRIGGSGAWVAVSAGSQHTCGITTAKYLYCWGDDGFAQIGDGTPGGIHPTMKRIA